MGVTMYTTRHFIYFSLLLSSYLLHVESCTTVGVGKGASADGSVMVSHSDDSESGADARLMVVPSRTYPAGSERPVYWDTEGFPRYVGYERGPGYYPKEGQKLSVPIGFIPQVERTYAYFEATYGIMNEHQVGIAESTCSGVFEADAIGYGGNALLSIDELSRIGLERCNTSRCLVQLIGDLAVKYGFYGSGGFEGGSESLLVSDPNELFVFHILPDDSGTSAIWVAQRVPDDHITTVTNMFVVRQVNSSQPEDFLHSPNMHEIAERHGLWKPGQPFDFTAIYSDGEYAHKFYSGRRMWGVYLLLAPSLDLPSNYTNLRYDLVYPTSAPPDKKVSVQDVAAVHRFYYQGTEFDMTVGPAAGPWGNPDRYYTNTELTGAWERSIGLYRTSETHIVQSRSWLPAYQGGIMWYAPHCTTGSVFVPFAAHMTNSGILEDYSIGNPDKLQRDSAYWAFRYVYNVAHIKYKYMMQDVARVQDEMETDGVNLIDELDRLHTVVPTEELTLRYNAHARKVLATWWQMPDYLIPRWADGWKDDAKGPTYTDAWLKEVGYRNGPPPPPPVPPLPREETPFVFAASSE